MNERFMFRVWNGEMYTEPFYLPLLDFDLIACKSSVGGFNDSHGVSALWDTMIEDGAVIEQCTGLKDKNDKLIYEGDIVDFGVDEPKEILFKHGGFGWWGLGGEEYDDFVSFSGHNYLDKILPRLAVIGNIHENKDLLNA